MDNRVDLLEHNIDLDDVHTELMWKFVVSCLVKNFVS